MVPRDRILLVWGDRMAAKGFADQGNYCICFCRLAKAKTHISEAELILDFVPCIESLMTCEKFRISERKVQIIVMMGS